ncbi:hypothetical protein RQP46_009398 [Phenoliferia psychrophenolica]
MAYRSPSPYQLDRGRPLTPTFPPNFRRSTSASGGSQSIHPPPNVFQARKVLYTRARSALLDAEQTYRAATNAYHATGSKINSSAHLALRRAAHALERARVAKEDAATRFAAAGGSERPANLPSPQSLTLPYQPAALPGDVVVTALRGVPGFKAVTIKPIGVTVGNHDGIYRSAAQMSTLKRRLVASARSIGADAVLEVVVTDVTDIPGNVPPTIIGQGWAVRLVPMTQSERSSQRSSDLY